MVTVAQQHQYQDQLNEKEGENGSQNAGDHRGVTIKDIYDESAVDYPSDSVGNSSLEDRGYGTDAICVRSESDIRRIDLEDASHTSSTQYSDVDDSSEGDELGSWSNDLSVPGSQVLQHFDNGVALPISEVPAFGDVSVKNSANVHFGNKTFYNGPVTIKQIVYSNPNSLEDNDVEDVVNDSDNKVPKRDHQNGYKSSGTATSTTVDSENPQSDYKVSRLREWLLTWRCVALMCAMGLFLVAAVVAELFEEEWNFVSVSRLCDWLLTWRCVALMCAMGSCLVAAVVVSVVLLTRDSQGPVFPEIPESSIDGVTSKLRFVERAEWGAQPPIEVTKLDTPVPYVIISHTVTDFCRTQSECTFRVRFAQTFHIESRNWSDIAYNFLIGGDGYAYVGRGWDSVGAHSYGYNTKSIGISFIGTFNTVVPPKHQLLAAQQLIEYGVNGGKIASDYKLLGHRQISQTLSPGDALYSVMTKWPHWSPKP